jgi:hypothetical protein
MVFLRLSVVSSMRQCRTARGKRNPGLVGLHFLGKIVRYRHRCHKTGTSSFGVALRIAAQCGSRGGDDDDAKNLPDGFAAVTLM